MKVCIFSANYLPNLGGVERYTYHLSKELTALGHSVTVITSNTMNLSAVEINDGIKIYRMPCYNVMHGRYPVCKRNNEFKKMDMLLKEENFDFAVINTRFYFHSLYGAKLAHSQKIPCITIEHGSSHLSVNNRFFDYFGEKWEHMITAMLKKYCDDFYGVSKAACEWSGHFGIRSKGVLYNSVDLNKIEKMLGSPVCSYKEQLKIPDETVVITYTGRLVIEKGSVELVKAFIKCNNKKSHLIIAGEGEMYNELEKLSNGHHNITLLGKIDFEHIVALLKESDVFCLPTIYPEGLPTSILEAIAAKNFIITTTYGGAKELITDPEYGILLDDNSEEKIVRAIDAALNDKKYRISAAENSYQRLKEGFTWEKTAKRLEEIMEMKTQG